MISFVVVDVALVFGYIAAATELTVVGFAFVGTMNVASLSGKVDKDDGSSSKKSLSHKTSNVSNLVTVQN